MLLGVRWKLVRHLKVNPEQFLNGSLIFVSIKPPQDSTLRDMPHEALMKVIHCVGPFLITR